MRRRCYEPVCACVHCLGVSKGDTRLLKGFHLLWLKRWLWHKYLVLSAWRAAVNCSGLLYAGTSQNCNLTAWFASLFLLLGKNNQALILDVYSMVLFL